MKKVLYIIDDINYNSGAKKVTLLQMQEMQKQYDVYLLSLAAPNESVRFLDMDHILGTEIWKQTDIYATAFNKVMSNREYSMLQKLSRFIYTVSLRCGLGDSFFKCLIKRKIKKVLETFDTVIVVSEASKLRGIVSNLDKPKKIQWIHTDYARWSGYSEWSRAVTRNDSKLYTRYDTIVVLSDYCKKGMVEKLPTLADKIVVIPNLIDGDTILNMAKEPCPIPINKDILNLVTVARIDTEKRIGELLKIAKKMQDQGVAFKWYIIGDGPQRMELENRRKELGVEAQTLFLGHLDNPYAVMSRCSALVLLSKYEGTPVTIDEAMVLGLGIIAPLIGGIAEQVSNYENSFLIKNDDFDINQICSIFTGISSLDYQERNNIRANLIHAII